MKTETSYVVQWWGVGTWSDIIQIVPIHTEREARIEMASARRRLADGKYRIVKRVTTERVIK